MQRLKKWTMIVFAVILATAFVQSAGGYIAAQLNSLGLEEHQAELYIEEKVLKHHVLQLKPREYYTVQAGVYDNIVDAQKAIDIFADAGYRTVVFDGPPYQLWLGCLGTAPALENLSDEIKNLGSNVFVQKQILNQVNFQFSANEDAQRNTAALVASLDVLIGHSLQMFQDYQYEACSEANWNEMIGQIREELRIIAESADNLASNTTYVHQIAGLKNVLSALKCFDDSLLFITEKKSTQAILIAQSYLLELIADYHSFIRQNSVYNG